MRWSFKLKLYVSTKIDIQKVFISFAISRFDAVSMETFEAIPVHMETVIK